jgi:phenylalanyl-tRNA synthetase alpha chain
LTEEGKKFLKTGFPEIRVLFSALEGKTLDSLSHEEKSIGISWAIKNGFVKIENQKLVPLEKNIKKFEDYSLHQALSLVENQKIDQINKDLIAVLQKRKLVEEVFEKQFILEKKHFDKAEVEKQKEEKLINQLTREMLLSKEWKQYRLRPYDINEHVELPIPAKRHIASLLMNKIAKIFAEMGFEQMEGEEIESAFWNFDALFQPQDHPARELADTFYLKFDSQLPEKELVQKVKKAHKAWGGEWLESNAKKTVLRTHTTALSAKYLYKECNNRLPKKYFAIGKVYRNEATDYKHLAEFYQIEGIVVWEGATFRHLLGLLKEFYKKLGFEKIRFYPSYFPYTEPSLEISVFFEKRNQWLELGGAGIFRPEVSIPLCNRYPVLAFGLSLERPLMLLHDIEDIRVFYNSHIQWLRSQK